MKILLVDDYGHTRFVLTSILETRMLAVVEVAKNGEEACERAREGKFDVIVMDTEMPDMKGYKAIEIIRIFPRYEDIPIISMITFPEMEEECIRAGATECMRKPINRELLVERIAWLLNHPP